MGQSRTVCRLFHHIVTTVTLESIVSTISYSRSCNNYFGSHFLNKGVGSLYCKWFFLWYYCCPADRSPSSSVSIVSGYGLDYRAIGVRSPAGAKDFSSNLCVQTGSEAHPASCTMGTGVPFPGAKHGRGVTLTTHPHLVPMLRNSRSYISSLPPAPQWRVAGLLCFCPADVMVLVAEWRTRLEFLWASKSAFCRC
jgi:hypothetical protein